MHSRGTQDKMMKIRSYGELSRLQTFEERFEYLKLGGSVGQETFAHERYLNQNFYRSKEWKTVRNHVIARDLGYDLGVEGYPVHDRLIIHHMNPMVPRDIYRYESWILDPEFLIVTTHTTHNEIHYGASHTPSRAFVERKPGDTKLW